MSGKVYCKNCKHADFWANDIMNLFCRGKLTPTGSQYVGNDDFAMSSRIDLNTNGECPYYKENTKFKKWLHRNAR